MPLSYLHHTPNHVEKVISIISLFLFWLWMTWRFAKQLWKLHREIRETDQQIREQEEVLRGLDQKILKLTQRERTAEENLAWLRVNLKRKDLGLPPL